MSLNLIDLNIIEINSLIKNEKKIFSNFFYAAHFLNSYRTDSDMVK